MRFIDLGDHSEFFRYPWQNLNSDWNGVFYEAKLIGSFDHRLSTFEGVSQDRSKKGQPRLALLQEKRNPNFKISPRYYLPNQLVDELFRKYADYGREWLLVWREITRSTDLRTCIATPIPHSAPSRRCPAIGLSPSVNPAPLIANLNTFVCDYVARQKLSSAALGYFILKQLPVIPPQTYTPPLLDFIVPRVLELSYTAWDLQAFAQDVGYDGPPFIWDEERRFLMRCELDALYFHLYQINRDDVDYIMETFPIVKRKDIARTSDENGDNGEYLTKRIILEMYDEMAELPKMAVPAPKDENDTYDVPDVGQWETWLSPPPASPDVAHEEKE